MLIFFYFYIIEHFQKITKSSLHYCGCLNTFFKIWGITLLSGLKRTSDLRQGAEKFSAKPTS